MTDDAILIGARDVIGESFAELRRCLDGLSVDALNWRPTADATNSLAALTTHALGSSRAWLCLAFDQPLPQRRRDAEFLASFADAAAARASADALIAECQRLLDTAAVADWAVRRQTFPRAATGQPMEVSAAWALLHVVDHLREHVGQMMLTRQLWQAQAPR